MQTEPVDLVQPNADWYGNKLLLIIAFVLNLFKWVKIGKIKPFLEER